MPSELQAAADPPAAGRDFGAAEGAAFSIQVLTNNIQVTLTAFAGGILFGVGTVLALVFNGLVLGVVAGLAIDAGNGAAFLRLVSAHGPLELSCIVVGGAAGLRMGWALIGPGPRRRGRALVVEARKAVEIALGTVPWLVAVRVRGGLPHRPELPLAVQLAIGVVLAGVFWGLVAWRGGLYTPGARLRPQVGGDAGAGQPVGRRLEHGRARRRGPARRRASARRGRRRPRRRVRDRPSLSGAVVASASSCGSAGLATTTAWRRVSTGIASTSGRAAASSSRSQRTSTNARLEPSTRRKASS